MSYVSRITIALISAYQRTVSPDHGNIQLPWLMGRCKFYPSCSLYTQQAIIHRGFLKGVLKGIWRILRCNPFSRGGYDPVEKSKMIAETGYAQNLS